MKCKNCGRDIRQSGSLWVDDTNVDPQYCWGQTGPSTNPHIPEPFKILISTGFNIVNEPLGIVEIFDPKETVDLLISGKYQIVPTFETHESPELIGLSVIPVISIFGDHHRRGKSMIKYLKGISDANDLLVKDRDKEAAMSKVIKVYEDLLTEKGYGSIVDLGKKILESSW